MMKFVCVSFTHNEKKFNSVFLSNGEKKGKKATRVRILVAGVWDEGRKIEFYIYGTWAHFAIHTQQKIQWQ